jgi:hypothetical protein
MESRVRKATGSPPGVGNAVNFNNGALGNRANMVLGRYNGALSKGVGRKWVDKVMEVFPDLISRPNTVLQNHAVHTAATLTTVAILKMFFCALWKFTNLVSVATNPVMLVAKLLEMVLNVAGGPAPAAIRKALSGRMDKALLDVVLTVALSAGGQMLLNGQATNRERLATAAAIWAGLSESGQLRLITAFVTFTVMETYEDFIRRHVIGKGFPIPSRFLSVSISPQVVRMVLWMLMEGPTVITRLCPTSIGVALTTQAFVETVRKLGLGAPGIITIAKVVDFLKKTPQWTRKLMPRRRPPSVQQINTNTITAQVANNKMRYGNLSEETLAQMLKNRKALQKANRQRQVRASGITLGPKLSRWGKVLRLPGHSRLEPNETVYRTPHNNMVINLEGVLERKMLMRNFPERMRRKALIPMQKENIQITSVQNKVNAIEQIPLTMNNLATVRKSIATDARSNARSNAKAAVFG